jgi:hypothetical protein
MPASPSAHRSSWQEWSSSACGLNGPDAGVFLRADVPAGNYCLR